MNSKQSKFPQLIDQISQEQHKLIDTGTYFYNASLSGEAERYTSSKTTHTIHVWWARRPHNAMMPLVFGSIKKTTSEDSLALMKKLSFLDKENQEEILRDAQSSIFKDYTEKPKLLDMFGGGGTIPQASASLGIDTYSIDINPLSVFIQKCYLQYFPKLELTKSEIVDLLKQSGEKVLSNLKDDTDDLFPSRYYRGKHTIAYLWTYSKICNQCKYQFYVSNRPWVSKKIRNKANRGHYVAIKLITGDNAHDIELLDVDKNDAKKYQKRYEQNSFVNTKECPNCNKAIDELNISEMNDELVVKIINNGFGHGKSFYKASNIDYDRKRLRERETELLRSLSIIPENDFPTIPRWSGITNLTLYGINNSYKFLNLRQRIVLLQLIEHLEKEFDNITKKFGNIELAKFIVGILSSLIDQLVDWNSRITMWISQNLQPGRSLSGPGVPMYWDYCEIDPLMDGPGNLWSKLKRVIKGVKSLPQTLTSSSIKIGVAQNLEFKDEYFDAIVTDPPYYDNLFYSILADFIYPWKYQLFENVSPEVFNNFSTENNLELVASSYRNENNSLKAHNFYIDQMTKALLEAERVLKTDGILSFIYSHSSLNGWIAIIESFSQTSLMLTSIQPLTIERKARPRGMNAESVDSCIVFVGRKLDSYNQSPSTIEEIRLKLTDIGSSLKTRLLELNWDQVDIGLAIFANGAAMIANLNQVLTSQDIRNYLLSIENITKRIIPNFKLKKRNSI